MDSRISCSLSSISHEIRHLLSSDNLQDDSVVWKVCVRWTDERWTDEQMNIFDEHFWNLMLSLQCLPVNWRALLSNIFGPWSFFWACPVEILTKKFHPNFWPIFGVRIDSELIFRTPQSPSIMGPKIAEYNPLNKKIMKTFRVFYSSLIFIFLPSAHAQTSSDLSQNSSNRFWAWAVVPRSNLAVLIF